MSPTLLRPAIALVLWTFVMWTWMYLTRLPAIRRAGMQLDPNAPRGEQMSTLPPSVRWKADNYNHLFEQPTLFYATAISLAVMGVEGVVDAALAWAYVALRVAHSVFQATVNKIEVRFVLFVVSSLVLLALAIRAAVLLW
ncbi:MAPEG family protein [Sandaracinus amylolyticus]|uniref:MAPEG family protein n=1 Tax=Sandaracinus amylolyticus TaxID=927083 RepID=A0A0F6SGS6_9BACT|nr:MAPEG family protein [Sandaracinus amylolyticus]AKF09209.1 Hypothetical protein DB32_006358 [Sandaracinus amylolyticus]